MATKKNETSDSGVKPAPAIADAADAAYDKQYRDNPDKPSEKSVAQVEVRSDEQ